MKSSQHKGLFVGIVLGVAATGLAPLLFAQQGTTQLAKPPAKSTQQRRLDAAAKVIDSIQKKTPGRIEDPELWHTWQIRWLESARALAPEAKARVQVHTEFRDRMQAFADKAQEGRNYFPAVDRAIADYYLAEAEELLEQEARK